jgi:hypothetical protein
VIKIQTLKQESFATKRERMLAEIGRDIASKMTLLYDHPYYGNVKFNIKDGHCVNFNIEETGKIQELS